MLISQISGSLARLTRFAQGQTFGLLGCARICTRLWARLHLSLLKTDAFIT